MLNSLRLKDGFSTQLFQSRTGQSIENLSPKLEKAVDLGLLIKDDNWIKPSEKGFFADALFLFDKVLEKQTTISVIGRSLGSGVATYLASKRPVKKMALISPFDSITRVAQNNFMIFPMFLMLLDKYDSISRVKDIKAETFVLIAEHDEVIPRIHSQRLIDEFAAEQITVKIIADSRHNDISDKVEYYQLLKDFFSK